MRQTPSQATSRTDLRQKLSVNAGGVVFTTIQKFFPEERGDTHPLLSDRRNIVVIADEAHRSQYDFIDGFARHMRDALPNASFLGFTGTPIEMEDANTRAVFGNYISIYDIQRSEEDKATVPIYFESRLAKLVLDEAEKPNIDPEFDEATEGEEIEHKEALKTKWAQQEAIVGSGKRVKQIAQDLVDHFEARLGRNGRQGHDRLHEPPHLRRPLPGTGEPPSRVAEQRRHSGSDQGGDDRVGNRPAGLATAHQDKESEGVSGQPVPKPRRPVPGRPDPRHVANRFRRTQPPHHVPRQAHAGPRPLPGHNKGKPGSSRTNPEGLWSTTWAWPTISERQWIPTPSRRGERPGHLQPGGRGRRHAGGSTRSAAVCSTGLTGPPGKQAPPRRN